MSSDVLRVRRAPRLETEIVVPGDKSISHRAIMLSRSLQRRLQDHEFSRRGGLSQHH